VSAIPGWLVIENPPRGEIRYLSFAAVSSATFHTAPAIEETGYGEGQAEQMIAHFTYGTREVAYYDEDAVEAFNRWRDFVGQVQQAFPARPIDAVE